MSVPVARAFCAAIGGSVSITGAKASRICSTVCETPKSKLKSLRPEETQGKLQPIRSLKACSFSSGARETKTKVTSRAWRWGTKLLTASAIDEFVGQPATELGPNMRGGRGGG